MSVDTDNIMEYVKTNQYTSYVGGGKEHNNLQPYIMLYVEKNCITNKIKLKQGRIMYSSTLFYSNKLEAYYLSLNKIFKKINVRNIKYPNTNLTYEQILKKELNRFADILQRNINEYYILYSPTTYDRGNHGSDLKNTLTVDDICSLSVENNMITCRVLINENAIYNSILDGGPANALFFINDEWDVKKNVWFKDIYRFGYYEGTHFIENAIDEFNQNNKDNIKTEVIRPQFYY